MTFRRWLFEQRQRRDAVGDLARDAYADRSECGAVSPVAWRRRLDDMGGCDGAYTALERAEREYGDHGVSRS
jgi:hypothetical protein